MEYTYEIINNYKIIKVEVLGDLIIKESESLGKRIRRKAKRMDYAILFDLTHIRNRIAANEAYLWYANRRDILDINFRYIPVAYLINKNQEPLFGPFKIFCLNNGVLLRIFDEKEKAFEWLKPL